MTRVLVSFLGIGNGKAPPDGPYDEAVYTFDDRKAPATRFAPVAITHLLGPFDRVIVLRTAESSVWIDRVMEELSAVPGQSMDGWIDPPALVSTDMTVPNQWAWFEQLLALIAPGDSVSFDFTHGMRAVPIVFSSAIGFLRRARNIELEHALYAWYDRARVGCEHPIVDMREFYAINDWAESVSRLTEDADARKLAELAAENRSIDALQALGSSELVEAFTSATDCIRNVDVNNIGARVRQALDVVARHRSRATGSSALLLDLVTEKFRHVALDEVLDQGRYDEAYFTLQLEIIKILIEHRLYMQAFTGMRECIGSIGMLGLSGKYAKNLRSRAGRDLRPRFADLFVNMLQFARHEWRFDRNEPMSASSLAELEPWLDHLRSSGVEQLLRSFVKDLVTLRNGFDHAWTSKAGADPRVESAADEHHQKLAEAVRRALEARPSFKPGT